MSNIDRNVPTNVFYGQNDVLPHDIVVGLSYGLGDGAGGDQGGRRAAAT